MAAAISAYTEVCVHVASTNSSFSHRVTFMVPAFCLLATIVLALISYHSPHYSASQASHLDKSDTTMWYQLGLTACCVGDLLLARGAFEQALSCNHSYWPAINQLCTVLMALEDYNGLFSSLSQSLPCDIKKHTALYIVV